MLELLCIKSNSLQACSWTIFFCLGSACLLNEPKTKVQTWLIYKQTIYEQAIYEAEPKLFIIGLVHLHSYVLASLIFI